MIPKLVLLSSRKLKFYVLRIDYLLKAETSVNLLKAQELLFRTEELLSQLLIVPVSQAASEEFDRLRAVSKLRKIGRADLLIASIDEGKPSHVGDKKCSAF